MHSNVIQYWYINNEKKIDAIEVPKKFPNFNKFWKERYKVQQNLRNPKAIDEKKDIVVHQNIFRREIHTVVSEIDYLKNNSTDIDEGRESIIYLMELGKARKDISVDNKYNINSLIEQELDKESGKIGEEKILKLSVYGIYDWITIKEKKPIIEITKKFQELLDKTTVEYKVDDLKYFKSKQILMKVYKGIDGENITDKKLFSVIFNIEISKKINTKDCSNGYNNLNKAIKKIDDTLLAHKPFFKRADIYKSLGPKDMTVIVQELSLDVIFKILEELNQQKSDTSEGEILRTFTMLASDFGASPRIEDDFSLVSYLRVSNTFKEEDKKILVNKKKMLRIHEVTGVMDIRIEWNKDTKIDDVLDFYNHMTEKSYLTDFQTKIEKEISLEN